MKTIKLISIILVSLNVLFSLLNTIHAWELSGWFCSTLGWTVALTWICNDKENK